MAFRSVSKLFYDNFHLFLGIILGLYLSSFLSLKSLNCGSGTGLGNDSAQEIINASVNHFAPKILTRKPPQSDKKTKLIRPRYYSTELGIREKLFVGIFTSDERVNTQAVHVNKTVGHLVDKIKFFITAQYKLKTKFNLTGLVGFTDTRMKYRPFQVIKYVGDSFGQDYDYYFFTNDYTFINAHKLNDLVRKISVSTDMYLGVRVKDGSYCDLDSGIILSNSVLKAVRLHLDWCIINAVSDDHSENIGRCIYHSLGLSCQETVQNEKLSSFKLKHFEFKSHLVDLKDRKEFREAVTVHPVLQKDDFYLLNAYFLKERLALLNQQIDDLSEKLTDTWPPGQRPGAVPATRFDLPKQYYFNMTHLFFPDDFSNIRPHTEPELLDIQNVIEEVKAYVSNEHLKDLQYRRLVNGYKTFDLSRGMDYTLDLGFRDLTTGKEVIKRFEVAKPLGNVEFIPTVYVTENTRVTILLPVQETEVTLALDFLNDYITHIMDKKEKTFLMLVLLYQYNSESKGPGDIFSEIKAIATKTSTKYKNEDLKIAWVSIRLPETKLPVYTEDVPAINFAVIDLALKKVGVDSMVLVLDVYANITGDFLNRVRMNTIANSQVFSPIPFRQYNPKVSQIESLEVNKNVGRFDRNQYKYISFYGRDYVYGRKKFQHILPLIRVDNDINGILDVDHRNIGNVFEMFLKYHDIVHCMRATEMNLKVKYHEEKRPDVEDLFLGNEVQLAKLLLAKEKIWEAL